MKCLADLLDLKTMTTAQIFALKTRINEELNTRQQRFLDELHANEAKKREGANG